MKRKRSIFDRVRLTPSQAREVANRRKNDARKLAESRLNKHANGAMYLGGYAIECSLKARLIEKYPDLSRNTNDLPARLEKIHRLVYKDHDLEKLLTYLPELQAEVSTVNPQHSAQLADTLKQICATWTILARYSPSHAKISDADDFLDMIDKVLPWLR